MSTLNVKLNIFTHTLLGISIAQQVVQNILVANHNAIVRPFQLVQHIHIRIRDWPRVNIVQGTLKCKRRLNIFFNYKILRPPL